MHARARAHICALVVKRVVLLNSEPYVRGVIIGPGIGSCK